jgi:N-acetylglucosaminyldiphosphoundecaprenol N-acetyl-beta-D-mannosaminyltransferase
MDKYPLNSATVGGAPVTLLGVPFDNVTVKEAIGAIERMIAFRRPHYVVTANVDFLVQARGDVELRRILLESHLVLCDGTPLVWASKWMGNALPERVAGSDLVPLLIQLSAVKGYRLFFLGGAPETLNRAVANVRSQHPRVVIAGQYSPPYRELLEMDHEEIARRIADAAPDLLFVSFGCPKQEKWMAMHYRSLGVPVVMGVGGTIDFLAGRARRAPQWMQRSGTEWLFRLAQEPRRLFKRYASDLLPFASGVAQQWWRLRARKSARPGTLIAEATHEKLWDRVVLPARLDLEAAQRNRGLCEVVLNNCRSCVLDVAGVQFVDSSGVGLLIALQKRARATGRRLVLLAPTAPVLSTLRLLRLHDFFTMAKDTVELERLVSSTEPTRLNANAEYEASCVSWAGELTAANAPEVWQALMSRCENRPKLRLQIDVSRLQFVDSTGLALMLRARKHAQVAGMSLEFINPHPNVRNVIHLARMENLLLSNVA